MPGPIEPAKKRATAFIDGQNLYRHAKAAFGHHYPNYDPIKLHNAVCGENGWESFGVRFYTGVPSAAKDPMWHGFWSNRLLAMRRAGILVTTRPLRYRNVEVVLADGSTLLNEDGSLHVVETPQEKGIDVRLALDVIRLALGNQYDVAVIYSQDQDLAEVVAEIKEISRMQNRWVKVACAFPSGPRASASRGIDKTDWYRMEEAFYNACLDPRGYRPKRV